MKLKKRIYKLKQNKTEKISRTKYFQKFDMIFKRSKKRMLLKIDKHMYECFNGQSPF